jgi:CHAT domain-containing protein/tetratricopeptide (TPR) repeat protein
MLSNQREDLDKSIIYLTESILLPSRSWKVHGTKILQTLSFLALALVKRSRVNKLPEDAIQAATYLRILRDQPHQAFGIPRPKVTGVLIDALAFQVELKSGNVMANLAEMADLCRELLTLDTPNDHTTMSFALFLVALLSNLKVIPPEVWDPDQPVDQFIECLRAAREHQLMQDEARLALACCLYVRYSRTSMNDDYEEAASMLDEVITSGSAEDNFVDPAQQLVTMLATLRSSSHQTPEYSEEAIYRIRELLGSPFVKESLNPGLVFDLEGAANQRSLHFGSDGEVVKESLGNLSFSQLALRVSGVSYTEDDDSEVGRLYKNGDLLMRLLFEIDNDGTRINETIEKGRAILASSSPKDSLTSFPSLMFGEMLFQAFMHANKTEYLNEFINTRRQALDPSLPLRPIWRFRLLHQLSLTLIIRSKMLSKLLPDRSMQDMDEALELLSQCVNNKHGRLPDRCWFACRWAYIARDNRHPTVSTAYDSAMALMTDTLLFAPTLQLQHHTLATSDDFHKMSLDYASYRVDLGQLKEAIETLERGRALLWSEMRYLRASVGQLPQADLQLGQEFAAVNRDLEELTKSIPPSLDLLTDDDGASEDLRAVGPFGHLLVKQRKLLEERNKLISQIRALPGFDDYLVSPSFDTLRSAASSGPVIIINHSIWRSDILIILHDSPPSLIPTTDDFFVRANALKNELLDARHKHGPDSYQYNETLAHVLKELYDLVGKPVIDTLRQLNVPEQSRVWWCPTSVFCSLPLHAMGPIPSDNGGEDRYFLDLYIPSYTPTLSALVEPDYDEPGSPTSELPSLLLVAHFDVPSPDVSLLEVCKDVKVVQALEKRLSVKSLISENAKPTSVIDGLRDHQFVHFVCHGTLEAGKPFDAGFELHGNERLTLLDVVRSRLPAAEFAFLSACHTAELTEGSSADEGLHLAAAVQYCGFKSVVGTMWAMANEDGPDVAKYFYQSMFPKKEKGEPVPYYKKSASALRDAVKKLREKKRGITLERWVNFVHYGA